MSLNKALAAELQFEAASTKKILERVPNDKLTWKPHEKSMTLQRIASHIAELPTWVTNAIKKDGLDLGAGFQPTLLPSAEEMVSYYEKNVQEALETLESAAPEVFDEMWTLRRGDHIIFTMPKKVVIRNMAMNHLVHHRGQLSVFLRLLDVPIPGMYGPSADER
jgi:uncharacterized damage-inducible protein DinB